MFTDYIRQELGGDEAMLASVCADYPPFGKRILIDNGWWRTLRRDNVQLITNPIVRIGEHSVVTSEGEHEVDVLVMATGFRPLRLPFTVSGRDGLTLAKPGAAIPAILAPTSALRCRAPESLLHVWPRRRGYQCQHHPPQRAAQFATRSRCIRELIERDYAALDVRTEVHDAYNEKVDAASARWCGVIPRSTAGTTAGRMDEWPPISPFPSSITGR